jgi:hypothetical protein
MYTQLVVTRFRVTGAGVVWQYGCKKYNPLMGRLWVTNPALIPPVVTPATKKRALYCIGFRAVAALKNVGYFAHNPYKWGRAVA